MPAFLLIRPCGLRLPAHVPVELTLPCIFPVTGTPLPQKFLIDKAGRPVKRYSSGGAAGLAASAPARCAHQAAGIQTALWPRPSAGLSA